MTERSNGDGGSDGPMGHPTPPSSGVGLQNSHSNSSSSRTSNSVEGMGVGGQKRTGAGGEDGRGDSEEYLLGQQRQQQQMWKEVSV